MTKNHCDPQLSIAADPEVVKIIVRNLVDNAIKFSPPGGTISMEAKTNAIDNAVIFSIIDTGNGLAKNVRDQIYSDTQPIRNGTNDEKGFGLGLQLCMYYLALYNSELHIHSVEGRGSVFSFELHSSIT